MKKKRKKEVAALKGLILILFISGCIIAFYKGEEIGSHFWDGFYEKYLEEAGE